MKEFIVSARKFRPNTFSMVIGQDHITQTLKNAIARNQLAHAYLFTGPRGVGKTSCARIFARAINCLNPTPYHEACGVCESCVAFEKDRSFNIHELDAASNNSVDDIRALTDKVRIAPQVGKYSVYIIDEVHMLSTAAFNAFLKTLEEPPHYAIFILATTEKHKIIPTILSRCQVYDFNRIKVEDIVEYLKYIAKEQGVTYDEESLFLIAQRADGGMRDALSTFDRVVSFCGTDLIATKVAESIGTLDFNTYLKAMNFAIAEDFQSLLLLLDEILKKGFDAQTFIAGLGEHIRNLIMAKNSQTASLLEATSDMSKIYVQQAEGIDYEFLFNAMNLLSHADSSYKTATNRRLHAELALIKLCAIKKKEQIAELYPMPAITTGAKANAENSINADSNHTSEAGKKAVPTQNNIANEPVKANSTTVEATTSTTEEAKPSESLVITNTEKTKSTAEEPKNINAETPTSSKVVEVEKKVTSPRKSITGINLYNKEDKADSQDKEVAIEDTVPEFTPSEAQELIAQHYEKLLQLWRDKNRPRLASAMEIREINGNQIIISVPDKGLEEELQRVKYEIELDVKKLTGGVKSELLVEVKEVEYNYRPITTEQKYQHLANINPKILKLHKVFDLMT